MTQNLPAKNELLSVKDLRVYYPAKSKNSFNKSYVKAVDGISFTVYKGETFGLVGESGCGKSTAGAAIAGIIKPAGGSISFEGKEIKGISEKTQIIFQDPYSSLDPRFTIGRSIGEPLEIHKRGSKKERRQRVLGLMTEVGLREDYYSRFPHEFSGGQRQRAGVARALALNPPLIVCDEPVSALDVSIQAQILNLMQDMQSKYGLTYIFISHNLSVVKHICDRVAVMYLGHIMELGSREELFESPRHPYTKALLDAIPVPDPQAQTAGEIIEGDVPSPINPPGGCVFHTRCKKAGPVCTEKKPLLTELSTGHTAACHLLT